MFRTSGSSAGSGAAGPVLFTQGLAQLRSNLAMVLGAFDAVEVSARFDGGGSAPCATADELQRYATTLERVKDSQHALMRDLDSLNQVPVLPNRHRSSR
jgi:hypothetical protein